MEYIMNMAQLRWQVQVIGDVTNSFNKTKQPNIPKPGYTAH